MQSGTKYQDVRLTFFIKASPTSNHVAINKLVASNFLSLAKAACTSALASNSKRSSWVSRKNTFPRRLNGRSVKNGANNLWPLEKVGECLDSGELKEIAPLEFT